MASSKVGTSLGQNPFRIQDTFTWEDLARGSSRSAERSRYSWEVNDIPKNNEVHFFELQMNMLGGLDGFSMALSVRLHPYDYLAFSETTGLWAEEAKDLAPSVLAYLKGLFGNPLVQRVARRYGGRILEWLDSVTAIYEWEKDETH